MDLQKDFLKILIKEYTDFAFPKSNSYSSGSNQQFRIEVLLRSHNLEL